jgi:hypothetical protein
MDTIFDSQAPTVFILLGITYTSIYKAWLSIGAPMILGWCPSLLAHESESMLRTYLVCREKQERKRERERERNRQTDRNKQTALGRNTQFTNNSDPITSTSELLLRQNSVTAHAHQS